MKDESIRSAALTIDADGFYRLEYRVSSGQVIASLGTYSETMVREDLEETRRLEPQMVVLAAIDWRRKWARTDLSWMTNQT